MERNYIDSSSSSEDELYHLKPNFMPLQQNPVPVVEIVNNSVPGTYNYQTGKNKIYVSCRKQYVS